MKTSVILTTAVLTLAACSDAGPPASDTAAASQTGAADAPGPRSKLQVDLYVRNPETNEANHPAREVFDHFFAMETTWR